jgi:hypothetical protein
MEVYIIAGYLFFFWLRTQTWRENQDLAKVAERLELKNNWAKGQLFCKDYLKTVRICYIRYCFLIIIAVNNIWIAASCLVAEFLIKLIYYTRNVNKGVKLSNLYRMFYALEYNKMKNCKSLKSFSFEKDLAIEVILNKFKKLYVGDNNDIYELFWVKDNKGNHIIQIIGEVESWQSAYRYGNVNNAGSVEALIDGTPCNISSGQLYRMREIKKEKGIVEMYSISRLGGLGCVDF